MTWLTCEDEAPWVEEDEWKGRPIELCSSHWRGAPGRRSQVVAWDGEDLGAAVGRNSGA